MYVKKPDPSITLPPKSDTARKIEYLLHREGYSMAALGRIIGVSNAQIWRYVKGITRPSIRTLGKFCKLFNVRPEWLMRTETA